MLQTLLKMKLRMQTDNEYVKVVREFAKKDNAEVIVVCAKIEEEMAELEDEDKAMFLEELGITGIRTRSTH